MRALLRLSGSEKAYQAILKLIRSKVSLVLSHARCCVALCCPFFLMFNSMGDGGSRTRGWECLAGFCRWWLLL